MSFIDARLLDCVAYGFAFGPEFRTTITELKSGREVRNGEWARFRWRGVAPYQDIKPDAYAGILGAFLRAQGMRSTFRYRNWMEEAVVGQSLGVAPSGSTPVQLVRDYAPFGGASYRRTVTAPVAGTVTVFQNGVAKTGTVDTTTGLFTPTTAWGTFPTPAISSVTTATTGGSLDSGATYSYRVSATNASGETLASTAASVAVAAALATPVNAAFTTATTGGSLAAGTYSYRVAAKNAIGRTLASTATTIATTGTTSTVTVNWDAVSGATGYDVFGRVGGSELLIASVGAVTTYTDTGSITPAGALPTANTTATATNTTTVNWGAVSGATGYKVYGRTSGAEQLIASVGAVTTYTDTGSITPSGALPTANGTGGTLTANFEYDIVVRFDTDHLPFSYDDLQTINGELALVEVLS